MWIFCAWDQTPHIIWKLTQIFMKNFVKIWIIFFFAENYKKEKCAVKKELSLFSFNENICLVFWHVFFNNLRVLKTQDKIKIFVKKHKPNNHSFVLNRKNPKPTFNFCDCDDGSKSTSSSASISGRDTWISFSARLGHWSHTSVHSGHTRGIYEK